MSEGIQATNRRQRKKWLTRSQDAGAQGSGFWLEKRDEGRGLRAWLGVPHQGLYKKAVIRSTIIRESRHNGGNRVIDTHIQAQMANGTT